MEDSSSQFSASQWWQRIPVFAKVVIVLIVAFLLFWIGSFFIGTNANAAGPTQQQIDQVNYCMAVPGGCPSLGIVTWPEENTPSAGAIASGPNAGAACKYGLKNKWSLTAYFKTMAVGQSVHDWCFKNGRIVKRNSTKSVSVNDWGHFLLRFVAVDQWGHNYCVYAHPSDTYPTSCVYRALGIIGCCAGKAWIQSTSRCAATRICAYVCGPKGAYHSRQIVMGNCPS